MNTDFDSLTLSHFHEPFRPSHIDDWIQPLPEESPALQSTSTRVCDRCIARKIKCDLQRPTCSRCMEAQYQCVYSSTKKRPGPAKGSRRKSKLAPKKKKDTNLNDSGGSPLRADVFSGDGFHGAVCQVSEYLEWPVAQSAFLLPENVITEFPSSSSGGSPVPFMMAQSMSTESRASSLGSLFTPDQEASLLHSFLLHLHSSIPLFRKSFFLQQYRCGSISRELALTICIITAKTMGNPGVWSTSGGDYYLKCLLETNTFEDTPSPKLSLDKFRQATLLAFYKFHQEPGERAVMRIGQLTQKAYQCGLHQLDNPEQCPLFRHEAVSEDELEEWRYVWWCIYCLDSCSNTMAAAPFLVEVESIKTALVANSLLTSDNLPSHTSKIFLPADTNLLPQTITAITANPGDCNYNMRIVSLTVLREAATLRRLQVQNPSESLRARIAALEGQISSMRGALPTGYMNSARHVMENESSDEHFSRLVSVLFIQFARIVVTLPSGVQKDESEWLYRWHRTIEYCDDIISVLGQWNEQLPPPVDPAVCIIVSGILMLLHLHSCSRTTEAASHERVVLQEQTLVALLSRSTSIWQLNQCLLSSFKRFSQLASGQLAPKDVDQVLASAQGALHQNIFNMLALSFDGGGW